MMEFKDGIVYEDGKVVGISVLCWTCEDYAYLEIKDVSINSKCDYCDTSLELSKDFVDYIKTLPYK